MPAASSTATSRCGEPVSRQERRRQRRPGRCSTSASASARTEGSRSFTLQARTLGSPHYMAPEQITSPNEVDAPSISALLGGALYELLTGYQPFVGDTLSSLCAEVVHSEPRKNSSAAKTPKCTLPSGSAGFPRPCHCCHRRLWALVDDGDVRGTGGGVAIAVTGNHGEVFAECERRRRPMCFVAVEGVAVTHHACRRVVPGDGQGAAQRRGDRLRKTGRLRHRR